MIIVKIIGGLGNQMFQYAYAKALEQKGYNVKIDISAFNTYNLHGGYQLNKYNIDLQYSTEEENRKFYKNKLLSKILKKIGIKTAKVIKEKSLLFDENLLLPKDYKYIEGYFQSEKYFLKIREILLKQFIINTHISSYTKEIKWKILSINNSCSIHIRRGDFTNNINKNLHGTCDIVYYQKAISHVENKIGIQKYFIFSDDIEWVKENLKINNAIYIESSEIRLPHEDMYLMSLCNNNIIANSSFSWWAAWLTKNNNKTVVAPKRWFFDEILFQQSKDIVPNNWIKI